MSDYMEVCLKPLMVNEFPTTEDYSQINIHNRISGAYDKVCGQKHCLGDGYAEAR